jgi:hypothetical protein
MKNGKIVQKLIRRTHTNRIVNSETNFIPFLMKENTLEIIKEACKQQLLEYIVSKKRVIAVCI